MINSLDELLAALESGTLVEHRHVNVELKSNWHQDVGKDISALCNKLSLSRAFVVIGVSDGGVLCGHNQQWVKATEQQASGHLHHYLDPFQACGNVEAKFVRGAWILVMEIANPGALVYWNGKPYKIQGTNSKEMEPEESHGLTLSLPGLNDYSSQTREAPAVDAAAVQQLALRISSRHQSGLFADLHAVGTESTIHRLGIRGKQASRILFGDVSCRLVFYDVADHPTRDEVIRPLYRLFDKSIRQDVNDFLLKGKV